MNFMEKEQQQKLYQYSILNKSAKKGQILFAGSSLMEQFPVYELLLSSKQTCIIYNRGIGGFTTSDMLAHMKEQILDIAPSKIFINIGTNDISRADYTVEKLTTNYRKILERIKERLPQTKVYLMAYYPVNELDRNYGNEDERRFETRNNRNIQMANEAIAKLAEEMGHQYIDVNIGLRDERGMLKKEYTIDGIHMYANGYRVVWENLQKYL